MSSAADSGAITLLLRSAARGDQCARQQVVDIVYPQMRRIAAASFRREHAVHTLQPTALVHEAFLRLLDSSTVSFSDRIHFYATAARLMRRLLIDHARRRRNRRLAVQLMNAEPPTRPTVSQVDLAVMLERLALVDERAACVVDLRYWGGLDVPEIARELGVSTSTVQRDWEFARLWLAAEYGA